MQVENKTREYVNTGIGVLAGAAVYSAFPSFAVRTVLPILSKCRPVLPEENKKYWQAFKTAYKNSEYSQNIEMIPAKDGTLPKILTPERVKIIHVDEFNREEVSQNFLDRFYIRNKPQNFIRRILDRRLKNKQYSMVKIASEGNNAYCFNINRQHSLILLNKNKRALTLFHELGHAMNRQGEGIASVLSKKRQKCARYAPIIALLALLTKKNYNNKESWQQKISQSYRNVSGILAAVSMVPMVCEEGLASLNGEKLAKKVLDSKLFTKLKTHNRIALLSYLLKAIATGLSVYAAIWLKDTIAEPRICKN